MTREQSPEQEEVMVSTNSKETGFTLMEMLVVIAVIGILSSFILPGLSGVRTKAKVKSAQAEIAALASISGMIRQDTGSYIRLENFDNTDTDIPTLEYSLTDAVSTQAIDPPLDANTWDGPYTTYNNKSSGNPDVPDDPWGNDYIMEYSVSEEVMIIYSNGPNGTDETTAGATIPGGDDIVYKFR